MNAIIMTTEALINHIRCFQWTRQIKQLHIHHTWKPDHSDYNGKNGLELQNSMRNYHVNQNGWSDIAQHLTLLPDGLWATGRDFNLDPASIQGWNTGAFCIEMLGNFDTGYDKFGGNQAASIFEFCAFFTLDRKLSPEKDVKFHRDNPTAGKTCPGSGIGKSVFMQELNAGIELLQQSPHSEEAWKLEGINSLGAAGLLADPESWKAKINEPMPVWAVTILLNRLYKKLYGGEG